MAIYNSPFSCGVRCTGGYPYYDSPPAPKGNSHNPHKGEDYVPTDKSKEENWKLYSVANGTVILNSGSGAYGNHIVISTDEGQVVLFAHMKNKSLLKVGARVRANEFVGVAGSSGNVTGRHLHIEVHDSKTWKYGEKLLKPSDYVDFQDYAKPGEEEEDFDMPKVWKNGSTIEKVYQTTTDCKTKGKHIGSLNPRETANCYAIIDGCYLLSYDVTGTSAKKVGFVSYNGGIK